MAVLIAKKASVPFASFVFNGAGDFLYRDLATTSPATTKFTYSFWLKVDAYDGSGLAILGQVINTATFLDWIDFQIQASGDTFFVKQVVNNVIEWWEKSLGLSPDFPVSEWKHVVIRVDGTEAAAADRCRIYINNTELADGDADFDLNETNTLFENTLQHQIGGWDGVGSLDGRMAFIEVIDSLSLAPTEFAFDDAGTWKRKPYTGSYGTYGFRLDGTDGFNDASGNGQHFTGANMTVGANLDTADLPPYTN